MLEWDAMVMKNLETTIIAKSVVPFGRIYEWCSPLPIFSVDPHRTGAESTIKRNIETGGGKGEFQF